MDDSKKSVISSSMVDLKAELFRKQEEFRRQKAAGHGFVKGAKTEQKSKGNLWSRQNAGVATRAKKDEESEAGNHDEDVHVKSRRALEEKSRLYDKLSSSSIIPEEDGSNYYLVDFQKKVIDSIVEDREMKRRKEEEEKEEEAEQLALAAEIPAPDDPEEEWIDFTDSFGRSRRCMKKDLDHLLKQDRDLALAQSRKTVDSKTDKSDQVPTLMSSDMHREAMRQKWEKEMRELQEKGQQEIHYSNIRFDEIRDHGTGFYEFSKDHEKREEQLENLRKLREETVDERSHKDRIKDKRKAMMEERLAKVRQRRNLKEQPAEKTDEDNETIGPKLSEQSVTLDAEGVIKKEEMEREAEERRKAHVREWDKDKRRDLPGRKSYVEALRVEREPEFAPPSAYFEQPEIKPYQTSDSSRVKRLHASFKTSSLGFASPASRISQEVASPSRSDTADRSDESRCSVDYGKTIDSSETQTSRASSEFSETGPSGTASWTGYAANVDNNDINWTGSSMGCENFQQNSYVQPTQAAQYYQQQLMNATAQHPVVYHQHHVPQQQQYYQHQPLFIHDPSSAQSQQYNYAYTTGNLQLNEVHMNTGFSSITGAAVLDGSAATTATSCFTGTQESVKSEVDRSVAEPKKPKIPRMAIMDTRFVKNEAAPSAEDVLSASITQVTAVPYTPGSFTAAKQSTAKQYEESVAESRRKNQISSSPVLYTPEQLKKQQMLQLQEKEECDGKGTSDPEAEEKIQNFLSSLESDKNP